MVVGKRHGKETLGLDWKEWSEGEEMIQQISIFRKLMVYLPGLFGLHALGNPPRPVYYNEPLKVYMNGWTHARDFLGYWLWVVVHSLFDREWDCGLGKRIDSKIRHITTNRSW